MEYFDGMSNYEITELIIGYVNVEIGLMALIMTALFSYLAAAFFVGTKLTTFQVRSISTIYSGFYLILVATIVGVWEFTSAAREASGYYKLGTARGIADAAWLILLVFLFLSAWLVSLYFMLHSRKQE